MQEKIGTGHAEAWLRAGGKEAAQALIAFPSHSIQLVEEPGLLGNATQLQVNQEQGIAQSYDQWLEAKTPAPREQPAQELQAERER